MAVGIPEQQQNDENTIYQEETSFTTTTKPNVFITGSHSNLIRTLIPILRQGGYSIHTIAHTPQQARMVSLLGATSVLLVPSPLQITEECIQTLQSCTLAIHCATAYTHLPDCAIEMFVKAFNDYRSSVIKLIMISSCSVLIDECAINRQQEADGGECMRYKAMGNAGKALQKAENIVMNNSNSKTKIKTMVILRLALTWGGQNDKFTNSLIKTCESDTLRLVQYGNFHTSTCHVLNACAALKASLRNASSSQKRIYYVTDGGDCVKYRDFVRLVLKAGCVDDGLIERAMQRRLPLWVARKIARLSTWILGSDAMTEASVCRVGLEVCVNDYDTRWELMYRNVVSLRDGMRMLRVTCNKLIPSVGDLKGDWS